VWGHGSGLLSESGHDAIGSMRGSDALICAYYRLHGRALPSYGEEHLVFGKACEKCESKRSDWKPTEERWVCGHCGEDWPKYLQTQLRARPENPRPGVTEDFLLAVLPVGIAINGMLREREWSWEARVLVAVALSGCSLEDLLLVAKAQGAPFRTVERLEDALRRARREFTRRLERYR
jgi:hypothetical protein